MLAPGQEPRRARRCASRGGEVLKRQAEAAGDAGVIPPGSVRELKLDVWSSTRDQLDLKLELSHPDPFFVIDSKPLNKEECASLERKLQSEKVDTRVRSAHKVSIKIHETKDGTQFDQGSFYRKLFVNLKRFLHEELIY